MNNQIPIFASEMETPILPSFFCDLFTACWSTNTNLSFRVQSAPGQRR
uniref:Uncharacterized protein n=1 Tax=Arundo donax TaxID=35708 RepID=A0A0A8XSF5_ARUDO